MDHYNMTTAPITFKHLGPIWHYHLKLSLKLRRYTTISSLRFGILNNIKNDKKVHQSQEHQCHKTDL